jgi:hypothetical protein
LKILGLSRLVYIKKHSSLLVKSLKAEKEILLLWAAAVGQMVEHLPSVQAIEQ